MTDARSQGLFFSSVHWDFVVIRGSRKEIASDAANTIFHLLTWRLVEGRRKVTEHPCLSATWPQSLNCSQGQKYPSARLFMDALTTFPTPSLWFSSNFLRISKLDCLFLVSIGIYWRFIVEC